MKIILFFNIPFILLITCFKTNYNETKKEKINILQQINVLHSSIKGDTLELLSDDKLIWSPFNVDTISEKSLQCQYNNIFKIRKIKDNIIILCERNSLIEIQKNIPVPNAEHLSEYHHTRVSSYYLSKAYISTPLIKLQHDIKVGMKKSDFFKLINNFFCLKEKINVVRFFDPPGDFIEQSYFFDKEKLVLIKMNSTSVMSSKN